MLRKDEVMKIRVSIKLKLIIPVAMIFIIFAVSLAVFVYQTTSKKYISQGGSEAKSVATLIREMLDVETVEAVKNQDGDAAKYQKVLDFSNNMIEQTGAKYIYMIAEYDGKLKYFFSNNEEVAFIEDVEDTYAEPVRKALEGKPNALPYIDDSGYGKLLTAFVPIFNNKQEVIAAMGVDYDATFVSENIESVLKGIIAVFFGMLVLSLAVVYFIITRMVKQLKLVDKKLQELISSNGDLTQKIEVKNNDEIGDIGRKINELLEFIYVIVKNISNVSQNVTESIIRTKEAVNGSANEIEQVSASAEEVNAMIDESFSNITNITQVVDSVQEKLAIMSTNLSEGENLTNEIEKRATVICEEASEESKNVSNVSEQLTCSVQDKITRANDVSRIKELTAKILDVADKTSMLALNASIEAARAGEAGKGFSVVAEEISKLSEDTTVTAKEIQQISDMIVSVVAELSNESNNMINYVSDKTVGSCDKLKAVGEEYMESSRKVTEIFTNMHKQSKIIEDGMAQIFSAVNAVRDASEQCTVGVSEVAKLTVSLSENLQENKEQVKNNEEMMEKLESEVTKFVIN